VEFVRYAERAAELANAAVGDVDELARFLADRPWLADSVTPRDLPQVQRIQGRLRRVFEYGQAGRDDAAVRALNAMLADYPVSPFVSGHDSSSWHLHVAERRSIAGTLAAEAAMGMAVVVCDLGADRFGLCSSPPCTNAYVDTSPNRSRRYCSERCSSRANVAAYRARRRDAVRADQETIR
jgi:predicted RNA-binding Zn ribbon-like protein